MSIALLFVEVLSVALLVSYLSFYFGQWRKQHVPVTLVSFLAWYVSLLIIFVLPVDVSTTFYIRCLKHRVPSTNTPIFSLSTTANISDISAASTHSFIVSTLSSSDNYTSTSTPSSTAPFCRSPWLNLDPQSLSYFWHVVYWTSLMLTWLILPMMQSYAKAGNFTVLGKLKAALIDNAIYYGTYLVVFSTIFIYLLVKRTIKIDLSSLKVLVITASNTWGLFLVIVFLGYGLVEVPRTVWRSGDPAGSLRRAYFCLAQLSEEKIECEEELEDVLSDVKRYNQSISSSNHLRSFVDIIVVKSQEVSLETDLASRHDGNRSSSRPDEEDCPGEQLATEKTLIRLHAHLKLAQHRYTRGQALWQQAVQAAGHLEDVEQSRGSRVHEFSGAERGVEGAVAECSGWRPRVEWYWWCRVRPLLVRGAALVLAVGSVAVVWSECTFFVPRPVLSLFAGLLQLAAANYNFFFIVVSVEVELQLVCFITIGYLSLTVYFTVFRLRIFNYFRLLPNHQTDENSLIFSGMLLCRLTPPLCLNFLGLIHMDSHVVRSTQLEETSYTRFMGHLDVIGFIASGFNLYFPMLVLLLCVVTYLRLGTRCLHQLGVQQFIGSSDEMTQSLVEEGRCLLKRERQQMDRHNRLIERSERPGPRYQGYNVAGVRGVRGEGEIEAGGGINRGFGPGDKNTNASSAYRYTSLYSSSTEARQQQNSTDRSRLLDFQEPVEYNEDAVNQFLTGGSGGGGRAGGGVGGGTRGGGGGGWRADPPPTRTKRSLFDD